MNNKPLILVVDDQPQNIELLEAHLVPQGYDIITAQSSDEALEKLSENSIDLILLDVMMPAMDGFEVTRRAGQDNAHQLFPIVLVTALRDSEDRVKCILWVSHVLRSQIQRDSGCIRRPDLEAVL